MFVVTKQKGILTNYKITIIKVIGSFKLLQDYAFRYNLYFKSRSMISLYEKLGSAEAINSLTDKYFDYILADSNLSHFYKNTSKQSLKNKYKQFFTGLTGGPQNYQAKNLKTSHEKLQISKPDFDASWKHMQQAMRDFKIGQWLIDQMKTAFYSVQQEVVSSQKEKTLLERLGGAATINVVVEKYYEFQLNDPLTSHFFDNMDMKKLMQRQKQFLCMVTGGPHKYEGSDIRSSHQKYKIGVKEFDQYWLNMEKAFTLYHVNPAQIKELKSILYKLEEEVVKK